MLRVTGNKGVKQWHNMIHFTDTQQNNDLQGRMVNMNDI